MGHYAATKHGLVGLMRTLASEAGQYGIRVNSVHPGAVETAMAHDASRDEFWGRNPEGHNYFGANPLPLPRAEAREISEAVLWLASDESRYVTGAELVIDGGLSVK